MISTHHTGLRFLRRVMCSCDRSPQAERAQSTVEYALVLLGAAALALLVVSWVTGTDVVGRLFEAVFGRILRQAG
jgi:hypothetical protein